MDALDGYVTAVAFLAGGDVLFCAGRACVRGVCVWGGAGGGRALEALRCGGWAVAARLVGLG